MEVLAGLRLSGLMPGIGSIPPRQSPVLRSRAASVESLQQDMNYGCNEKSQPSAQREYAKCRAITSMQCLSLALRCLWVHDSPKIALSSNLRLPHPKDTMRPSPRVLQGWKLGNSSFEKHPPVLCELPVEAPRALNGDAFVCYTQNTSAGRHPAGWVPVLPVLSV